MDSAALGALTRIRRIRENEAGWCALQRPHAGPAAAHHRFDRIVPVEETIEGAVGALDRDPDA